MKNSTNFTCFVEKLYENAIQEFRDTEQYNLLKEKLEQMNRDCDTMLTDNEKHFAEECFLLIRDIDNQQEEYVYQKGLTDCVKILKHLGVLA